MRSSRQVPLAAEYMAEKRLQIAYYRNPLFETASSISGGRWLLTHMVAHSLALYDRNSD